MKKQKFKLKESTKTNLKNIFGSLISNNCAIEGSKSNPWWVSLIMFFLGVFIPTIPVMVTASKQYGASFCDSVTYNFDRQLTGATMYLKDNNYSLTINDSLLSVTKDGNAVTGSTKESVTPVYTYTNAVTNEINFRLFWCDQDISGVESLVETIKAQTFVKLSSDPSNDETLAEAKYTPSFLVLYKQGIFAGLYKDSSTTAGAGSYSGADWTTYESGTDLLKNVYVESATPSLMDDTYVSNTFNNWKTVFNKSYEHQKVISFWSNTGIYFGIYCALSAFLGFMIWLLTRGKKNMFNYLKVNTCMNIEAWASVAPGILGMIFSFLFSGSSFNMMLFILFLGMRVMWISMKQLRPQY